MLITSDTVVMTGAGLKVLAFNGGARKIPVGRYYIAVLFYENATQTGGGTLTIQRINSSGMDLEIGANTGNIANRVAYLSEASISGAPVLPENPTITYTYSTNAPLLAIRGI